MLIALGSDHAGFELKKKVKEFLVNKGYPVEDCGTDNGTESVDYPDFVRLVTKSIVTGKANRGILFCGSGIGVSISANKIDGVRCALCHNIFAAKLSRLHNDTNILALGAWFTPPEHACEIVDKWLNTEFEGGRHSKRVTKITNLENERNNV